MNEREMTSETMRFVADYVERQMLHLSRGPATDDVREWFHALSTTSTTLRYLAARLENSLRRDEDK